MGSLTAVWEPKNRMNSSGVMKMERENRLETGLRIWKDVYSQRRDREAEIGAHLSAEVLYNMACPAGLEASTPEAMNHLSRCPLCLEEWVQWRSALSAVASLEHEHGEEDGASTVMACGMREAAATAGSEEAVNIRSSCGRFVFGLFPQVDHPEKGMLTLEAVSDGHVNVEGKYAIVRDGNGSVVLEGRLHHGRLARICNHISEIDLSTWTLVVNEKENPQSMKT
jgi:hypothetical protein